MAKGQQRSNREMKKPKQKKDAPPPPGKNPFTSPPATKKR
jgi:hypothetical protein